MKLFSRFSICCDNNKTSHKGNPFHFLQNMRVSPFLYESDWVSFLKGVSRLHLLCVWENWFKNGEPSTCEDSRKFSKEPTMLSIPNPPQLYNFGFSDPIFCLKLSLLNSNVQFLILDFWYVNIAAQHLRQKCALSFDISYIIYDFFWVLNFFTSISWLSGFKMSNSSGWRRGKSVPWELPDNGRGGRKVGF